MKKVAVGLMLSLAGQVLAGTYYVATTGSDSAAGTIGAPFATLQKSANVMGAGDTCYIRGGNYHEAVVISGLNGSAGAPITFTAYTNEVVTINGSQPLTALGSAGWTLHSGNIYKTTLSSEIWQLYVDGELMIPARWPNGNFDDGSIWDRQNKWARGDEAASANGTLVDEPHTYSDLAASGLNMTGAMAILNVGSWKTWTRVVNSHSAGSGTFSYSSASSYKTVWHHYFLEGKLNLLDVEKEWFYDTGSKTLYLRVPGGGTPTGDIRGKTQTYAFNISNSSYVTLKGLNFFGTTFKFYNSENMTVENCDLLYPSCSKRMLGSMAAPEGTKITQPNKSNASNCTVKDCSFSFAESYAIYTDGDGNRIENSYFGNIDWVVSELPYLQAGIYMRGPNSVFSRNTVDTAGASELMEVGTTPLVEYCEFINYGLMQNDGAAIQYTIGAQPGSMTRYNWFHDAIKYGSRFDAPVGSPSGGSNGTMHHNVGWNNPAALMFKGTDHKCYNNTAFDTSNNGIIILDGDAGSNVGTITRNNAANKLSGHRSTFATIPGTHDHNWNGYVTSLDIRTQLRDPDLLDFRPKAGSDIIDAGVVVSGITDGYGGAEPDIGAYEYGASSYWIPGRKQAGASGPVPPDNASGVKTDADLMWREGYQATSHHVYFGTSPGSLVFQGNPSSNIFDPGTLAANTVYYWRVDAVTPSGTVTGSVSTFDTSAPAVPVEAQFTPVDDAYVQDSNPGSNYGSSTQIKLINGSPNREAYMKFNVAVTGVIASATLELHNSGGSRTHQVGVYSMTDTTWTEGSITWNNRPAINGALLDKKDVEAGSWATFDVSAAITSDGLVSFGLIRDPNAGQRFLDSKESAFVPVLKVVYTAPVATDYFAGWASGYSLGGQSGLLDNPDGDALNNLAEYAFGGAPDNPADAAGLLPVSGIESGGGSNWMEYVYRRRTDAATRGLSYTLEECSNLVSGAWSAILTAPSGTAPLEAGFEAVTHQIPATEANQFIRLRIGAPANEPPAFTADPLSKVNGTEDAAYSDSIAGDASDPESNPLSFLKISGPAWLSVASNGALSGTPGVGDAGLNSFTVQVNATGGSDTATLNITVVANQPPAFTADPFSKANGVKNAAYGGSIAGAAADPESDLLTFSKISGPAWLSVASNGALSGTPGAGDVGLNTFTVQVNATGGSDTATLNITVDAVGGMPTGYPAATGNDVSDEWIGRVQFSTIDQPSGPDGGYADRTTVSAHVSAGSSHTLTVTYTYAGSTYSEDLNVWIDFNRDGDFADAGEHCLTVDNQQNSASGSITIPLSASLGETRMRIAMSYAPEAGLSNAGSGSFTYGEVEDYKLVIQ